MDVEPDTSVTDRSSTDECCDFLVIGAGIVGLATARELRRRHPGSRIVVLEKEKRVGMHASGRNSGVLHSGIYYPPETLKAKVCRVGAERMREYAEERAIRCRRTGKLIVATREADLPVLRALYDNGQRSGIRVEWLDEKGAREVEPYASPYGAALYLPDTAVIDSLAVLQALEQDLSESGVELRFDCRVDRAMPAQRRVEAGGRRYSYGMVFNCAGAYADILAKRFGVGGQYALVPFKGLYYKLSPARADLVRGNIYPVPDPRLPFLGVHFTRSVEGDTYVGPTAMPALGRENYGILSGLRAGEAAGALWRLAWQYLRNAQNFRRLVHTELCNYIKPCFVRTARRLVNSLAAEDLLPSGKVGIRPQLINVRTGRLEMDFVVERTETSVHVLNAVSPAFTSAFAFAELVTENWDVQYNGSRINNGAAA